MIQNRYSFREELANTVTHGAGTLLSIAALTVLVAFSTLNKDIRFSIKLKLHNIQKSDPNPTLFANM